MAIATAPAVNWSIIERDHIPGVVSPSGLQRAALCPASVSREAAIPRESSPQAERGTRIHRAISDDNVAALAEEERDAANAIIGILNSEIREQIQERVEEFEKPIRATFGDYQVAGQPDLIVYPDDGSAPIIVDYKTGHIDVGAPEANWQMMAYAVMLHEAEGYNTIETAIIQPFARPRYRLASFPGAGEWVKYECAIIAALHAAYAEHPPAQPSPIACQYCAAKACCGEFMAWAESSVAAMNQALQHVEPSELTVNEAAETLDKLNALPLDAVAKLKKQIEAHLIDLGGGGGYEVAEREGRQFIANANEVAASLADACEAPVKMTLSLTDLRKEFRPRYKQLRPETDGRRTNNRDADEALTEMLGENLRRYEPTKYLVKE